MNAPARRALRLARTLLLTDLTAAPHGLTAGQHAEVNDVLSTLAQLVAADPGDPECQTCATPLTAGPDRSLYCSEACARFGPALRQASRLW